MQRKLAFMLIALKDRLGKWLQGPTLRLLLVEFGVVLAGVLAAQVLQDWFAERSERARAQEQRTGVIDALHNSAELADMRQRMYVCMADKIERTRDVLSGADTSGTFAATITVPEQNIMDDPGWQSARPLITRHLGLVEARIFSAIEYLQQEMNQAQDEELAAWQQLALLRPENGTLPTEARASLHLALADAARTNRLLKEAGGVLFGHTDRLGTPRHKATMDGYARSPKICAAMVAYSPEQHAEAFAKGQLPDGSPLHPRLLAAIAARPR